MRVRWGITSGQATEADRVTANFPVGTEATASRHVLSIAQKRRISESKLATFLQLVLDRAIRKFPALMMLALIGLPLATPLFASSRSSDATMPACCRLSGKHNCAGKIAGDSNATDAPRLNSVADPCPAYSQAFTPGSSGLAEPLVSVFSFASDLNKSCRSVRTDSMLRITCDRSSLKRGPPSSRLS